MKKAVKLIIAQTIALALALGMFGFASFATGALSANVYVTISDGKGNLVLVQQKIAVTDADKDGAITISDALYAAHEAKYPGGASAGFATAEGQYGLGMTKLWGVENGGSYFYYVDNKAASSLTDPVKEGDYVYAYAFSDTVTFLDTYGYFDVNTISVDEGKTFTLTLSAAAYDANWNPVITPVEGAVITVNGKATDFKTDANGKAEVKLEDQGTFTISATSSTMVLVPPVCVATVKSAGMSPVWYAVVAAVVLALVVIIVWVSRKSKMKKNEK